MTPFERNLDFWRQLWRVVERSDVIVQIVDARNPLLYRCEDLETYVMEVHENKSTMLLINKADHLTHAQREMWAKYFDSQGVQVAFWSAAEENKRLAEENKEAENIVGDDGGEDSDDDGGDDGGDDGEDGEKEGEDEDSPSNVAMHDVDNQSIEHGEAQDPSVDNEVPKAETMDTSEATNATNVDLAHTECQSCADGHCRLHESDAAAGIDTCSIVLEASMDAQHNSRSSRSSHQSTCNNAHLLTGEELIQLFNSLHAGPKFNEGYTTIGLVGYPNVGKSSTINAILQMKKVPVSATPGRTKHFQTLFVDKELMLCDCPGLVMPTFVTTKAHMVISGILPIDQMRDYLPPSALVCQLIPRSTLESCYGILLPKPLEGQDPKRPPTAHELLSTYGYMKGYMSHKGIPDMPRSARCILKDFVNGKLLYCFPPPGIDDVSFEATPAVPSHQAKGLAAPTPKLPKGAKPKQFRNDVDKQFFQTCGSKIASRGVHGVSDYRRTEGLGGHVGDQAASSSGSLQSLTEKPWKKHNNKMKKEKLRRLHAQLDCYD